MKIINKNETVKFYKKLSVYTASILVIFLLIYYAITVIFSMRMYDKVNVIQEHPFPVVIALGDIKGDIYQIRTLCERLEFIHTPEVIESVRIHYSEIDEEGNKAVQLVVEQYLPSVEESAQMQNLYEEIIDKQEELLELCSRTDVTDKDIKSFVEEDINPRIDELEELIEIMTGKATGKFNLYVSLIKDYKNTIIICSTILIVIVLTAITIYLYIIYKKELSEKQVQDDMKIALAAAKSANEAKTQFLSNMSHDIRTPMNAIIGMTDIAKANIDNPEKVKDCLEKVSTSSSHLLTLINDVLDMSKIESGKVIITEEIVDFSELLFNIYTIVQPQAKAQNHKFDIYLKDVVNEQVMGDTLHIQQVLINLITNAIKFTPAGGKIEVTLTQETTINHGYDTYKFVVSDNGIGMNELFLGHIFEPFERANTSTVSRTEGTGLGMAITKSIVDMMGGQLHIDSKVGEGTECTLYLYLKPYRGEGVSGNTERLIEYKALVFNDTRLKKGKALIVEDNEINIEVVEEMLKQYGITAYSVRDGLQAVQTIKSVSEDEYDIIFMDVQMPIMNGYKATREIRKYEKDIFGRHIPIIGMSANAFSEDIVTGKESGMDDYMTKPLSAEELWRVLDTFIN